MTEMSRPEGSLFLFTALLYLPESAAIFFTAAAPKQEDRGARSLYWILGDVVQRNRPQWWHRTSPLRHKCKQRDKSTYYFIIYFAVIRKHYNWSRVIKCLILYWLKTHQKIWIDLHSSAIYPFFTFSLHTKKQQYYLILSVVSNYLPFFMHDKLFQVCLKKECSPVDRCGICNCFMWPTTA